MNDMKFIETLKQKRKACDYSQSRLAQELQISRQNLNEIENGKTKASKEMKHILLHYLDYCNCTQPFTLTIDYLGIPILNNADTQAVRINFLAHYFSSLGLFFFFKNNCNM